MAETWEELTSARDSLSDGIRAFVAEIRERATEWEQDKTEAARDNAALHEAREVLHDMAQRCRDLTRQIDHAARLAGRVIDVAVGELDARESDLWENAGISRARRAVEDGQYSCVEALRRARYFVVQADWLQERFPDAELCDVEGLAKLVTRAEIEEHDWSLTPSRYVGVAPEEEDEDFDFDEAIRQIHVELNDLNADALQLAATIERNFEELAI